MELQRNLSKRLVARRILTLVATMALGPMLAACVADDPTAAGLSDGDGTLPSVTTGEVTTGEVAGGIAGGITDDDTTGDEPTTSASTVTTEATTTTEPLEPLQSLGAELVAEGFSQPIHVAPVPGTDRLVVVEREGVVRLVDADGQVADEPYLDLTDPAVLLSSSIEQGLLGLAFHPDHAANGLLYAYWTDAQGDSVLARFEVDDASATTVEVDSMTVLLTVEQPGERHNAGHLEFGPDGRLYVALGDGGTGGAPGQDTTDLLGSILRLDVAGDRDEPRASSVPDANPFGNEIWAYGLRNPWRFTIDPVTELMYIGDVGQDSFEEINVVRLDGDGTNFGWAAMEGDECFRGGCDTSGKAVPVLQIPHDEGCSVTGGVVYRGADIPEFTGHYFFGDWCEGFVRSFRIDPDSRGGDGSSSLPLSDAVVDQVNHSEALADIGQVTSFGLDHEGEILTVNWAGQLHRIVARR